MVTPLRDTSVVKLEPEPAANVLLAPIPVTVEVLVWLIVPVPPPEAIASVPVETDVKLPVITPVAFCTDEAVLLPDIAANAELYSAL